MSGDYYYCTHFHLLDHPFQLNLSSVVDAQRRPGHQPRRHDRRVVKSREQFRRSTKAEASAPATPTICCKSSCSLNSLNEGRGISPGDTFGVHVRMIESQFVRSTKAEASAPATQPIRVTTGSMSEQSLCAQRRPRHQPRRHAPSDRGRSSCSTKGGHQPRDTADSPRVLGEVRSTKAEASAPATRPRPVTRRHAAQRGRGIGHFRNCEHTPSSIRLELLHRNRFSPASPSMPRTWLAVSASVSRDTRSHICVARAAMTIGFGRILLILRPPIDHLPAVLRHQPQRSPWTTRVSAPRRKSPDRGMPASAQRSRLSSC